MPDDRAPFDPFNDLRRYVAMPRVGALVLSADGEHLVAPVSGVDVDGARVVTSIWALDPSGRAAARRLTRSERGETDPAFAADGSLLFISKRARPGAKGDEDTPAALWRLLPDGGEPWPVVTHPGGITAVACARRAPVVMFAAKVAPRDRGDGAEESWHDERRTRKISAILHEQLPIRHWDHERGPEEIHYFVARLPDAGAEPALLDGVRDITPSAGRALQQAHPVVSPDGTAVVTEWEVAMASGRVRSEIVRIDVASGEIVVLASRPDGAWSFDDPEISPDGERVACLAESRGTTKEPWLRALFVTGITGGELRPVHIDGDLWIDHACWNAESNALVVTGDLGGRHPLWRVDPDSGACTPVTVEGAWSHPVVAPDGSLYALRSGIDSPARPVRLPIGAGGALAGERDAVALDAPGALEVPGRVVELTGTAGDGAAVRAWVVLPRAASAEHPAPMLLWVHGGPQSSWNDWSWRWNPWLMAARGWAVLLPDPALSTGYGTDFVRRGWQEWGGRPYTDVMTMTDVAIARADIDEAHIAAMGGSYGGYMANWMAGHTDRFAAIVSHASIWSCEQFRATTDYPFAWTDSWGRPEDRPDFYRQWSPDTYVEAIHTPMLVIHGNDDYRCPVSESLRLWTDLVEHGVDAKFLSFPDENHWVLRPGDATVWYETVFAFLDHHVLGLPWARPAAL